MYYAESDGNMYSIRKGGIETDLNVQATEIDKVPWNRIGVNLQDYFNFGFDEEKWRLYINKQILMRFEKNLIQKHLNQKEMYERGNLRPEYNTVGSYMNQPMYYPPPNPYGGYFGGSN